MANQVATRSAYVDTGDHTTWNRVWTAPFRGIRAVYWAMDRDAKVRSRGATTVGEVTKKRTEREEVENGYSYSYYVSYAFKALGRDRTDEKEVDDFEDVGKGDRIMVFYLDEPDRFGSAIDKKPVRI